MARILQVSGLILFLGFAAWHHEFQISPLQVAVSVLSCLAFQMLFSFYSNTLKIRYSGALITSLSLVLLVRTTDIYPYVLIGFFAIGSKFCLTVNRRPIFNPSLFGVILGSLMLPTVWVAPSQWGQNPLLLGAFFGIGSFVVYKAKRWDISFSFLAMYVLLIMGRHWWLGYESSVTWNHLSHGSLLLFAFFMISDPVTSPSSRMGRVFQAWIVTGFFAMFKFYFYEPLGLLMALFVANTVFGAYDSYSRLTFSKLSGVCL